MLTYHPAFDSYHCIFRMLYLLNAMEEKPFEVDLVKIFDFYLCVPSALSQFRYSSSLSRNKRWGQQLKNDYNNSNNFKSLFFEVNKIQDEVLVHLTSIELIDNSNYRNGEILFNREKLPNNIQALIKTNKSINADVLDFLITELKDLPLLGRGGIKDRSSLMDHRYDIS